MTTREDILSLAPCPFCGGAAERVDIEDGTNAGGSFVHCTVCDASGNVEFEFKENFISNWNRRAAPTPPAAEAPGQEPVAVIGRDWQLLWYSPRGIETLSAICERTGAQVGDKLYRHPAPPTYADAEAKGFELTPEMVSEASAVLCASKACQCQHDPLEGGEGDCVQIATAMLEAAIRSLASPAPKGET